jgi:hypothetical protein
VLVGAVRDVLVATGVADAVLPNEKPDLADCEVVVLLTAGVVFDAADVAGAAGVAAAGAGVAGLPKEKPPVVAAGLSAGLPAVASAAAGFGAPKLKPPAAGAGAGSTQCKSESWIDLVSIEAETRTYLEKEYLKGRKYLLT